MRARPLEFIRERASVQGDVASFRLGRRPCFLVTSDEGIRTILHEAHASLPKNPHYTDTMSAVLGDGLITSDGELHRRQRRLVQPAFQGQHMDGFSRRIARLAADLADSWASNAESGEPVDACAAMNELTLAIVLQVLFGEDHPANATSAMLEAFGELNRQLNEDIFAIAKLPRWVPTPRNDRFRRALRRLDDAVLTLIARRRRTPAAGDDVISLLIAARDDETGESMTDRLLRDEILTMMAAGHETSADGLVWTLSLLAHEPAVAARVREEVRAGLRGGLPDRDAVARLPYTRMVIEETLRLYPPAYMFDRVARADVEVAGIPIPAGATVYLSPYVTHRKPEYWDSPDAVDPERFTRARAADRPRFAYFPFGAGPRQCIGGGFAMLEMHIVVATILQRWRLDPVSREMPAPRPHITLRPPDRVLLRVRPA